MTDISTEPTGSFAQTTDTSNDVLTPPGAEVFDLPEFETGNPTFEIAKLAAFIDETFPRELDRTNTQVPDSPVDVAIRLLMRLSATAGPHAITRCDQEYCNRPQGHTGDCGIVHASD